MAKRRKVTFDTYKAGKKKSTFLGKAKIKRRNPK